MKKILVATDGSPSALKAYATAVRLAEQESGSSIVLFCVAPLSYLDLATPYASMSGTAILPEQLESQLNQNADQRLDTTLKSVATQVPVKTQKLLAHPGDAICTLADEEKVDLIVIGAQGHSKLREFFTGSVTDYVVRHCHQPVLVVKAENPH